MGADRDRQEPEDGSHVPVLLREVVEWLVPSGRTSRDSPRFIDCTVGGGGHAAALLQASGTQSRLLGLDADPAALSVAARQLAPFGARATLERANFRELGVAAEQRGFGQVHGILMDLGLSSRQLDASGRGFSFRRDEPLDMRYDPTRGETATEMLSRIDERDLADMIFGYGEEHRSRRIAREIVRRRLERPLTRTGDLVSAVEAAVGRRRGRTHPATRTFQAVRIAVNRELEALELALPQAAALLAPEGRLAVISFHSLEDRRVKWFFRGGGPAETPLRALTGRPITPGDEDLRLNPRARSAKLRVAERVVSNGDVER